MEQLKQYSLGILLGNFVLTIFLGGYVYYTKMQHEAVINNQGAALLQVINFLNKAIAASTSTPAK